MKRKTAKINALVEKEEDPKTFGQTSERIKISNFQIPGILT